MRVAIYARVSTVAQAEEGYSLGAQVEDCTRYAREKLNATSINEFVDDGYSGAFLERPALEKLRQELVFGAYDAVVCYDADRLARGLTTQLIITDEIEKHCKLFFCNMDYQRTPEGQLFYQIKGAFSGYEREKIKQRSMRGKLAKLKQGKPIQNFRIYGYRYINEAYVIEPTEAEVVRLIFSAYLSGEYGGLLGVCKMLNDKGIPSPQGSTWQDPTLRNILMREAYTGTHIGNKLNWHKVSAHKIVRTEKPQADWLPIVMPEIISRDEYIQAMDKLKKGRMYRKTDDPYLVQGVAYCGVCGRRMSTSKHGRYVYLLCNSQLFTSRKHKSCGARVINLKAINEMFWPFLEKVCRNTKTLATYISKCDSTPAQSTTSIHKELKKVANEKQTLLDWWHTGIVSEVDVKQKLQALTLREKALQEKLKETVSAPNTKLAPEEIVKKVQDAGSTFADRQRVIRSILDKVVIERLDKTKRPKDLKVSIDLFFK